MRQSETQTTAKTKLSKASLAICKAVPTFITIIAFIAIVVHLCTYFEITTRVWYTMLLAGVTGLTAVTFPALAKRVKPLWSIVSAGITLLVLQVLPEWMTGEYYFVGALISVIAVFSEVFINTSSNLDWSNSFFKITISAIAGALIVNFENELATVITLIISYLIMTIINFSFKFSIRGYKTKVKVDTSKTETEDTDAIESPKTEMFITPPDEYEDISSK